MQADAPKIPTGTEPSLVRALLNSAVIQAQGLNRQLDMRTLINGFKDYMQWRDYSTGCHWRDMVSARLKERPIALEEAKTFVERAAEKCRDRDVAREIAKITDRQERLRLWQERTGKSQAALYRWLKKLKAPGLSDSQ